MHCLVSLLDLFRPTLPNHAQHLLVGAARSLDIGLTDKGQSEAHDVAVESGDDFERLDPGICIESTDPRTDIALEIHEPFGLESAQGLTHGNRADLQFTCDALGYQAASWCVGAVRDALANTQVGALLLGRRRQLDSQHLSAAMCSERFIRA